MAQSQIQLHEILTALEGVQDAYFQPKQDVKMQYPCIVYSRDDSYVAHADNLAYLFLKRYQVIVIDRKPDSIIPDQVEELPYTRFDRSYISSGLNHFVYNLFF